MPTIRCSFSRTRCASLGVTMAVGVGSSCLAGSTFFQYAATDPGQNSAGGQISSIVTTYNPSTSAFVWTATISNGAIADTDGFRLVVSPGPNPRTRDDEYAIIYFDATNLAAPRVSIYRYNGLDRPPTGGAHPNESFVNPSDLLASSNQPGSGISAAASESGNARTFTVSVNAAGINSQYNPGNGFPEWRGIQFGSQLGYWFHPFTGGVVSYSGNQITSLDWTTMGFSDASFERTTEIPAPGAAVGGLLVAGVLGGRRRRGT